MNSQNSPPPGHPHYSAGSDGKSAPQGPMDKEYSGSQYGCAPIAKRSRNHGDYAPNSAPFITMNPRVSRPQPNPPLNRGTSHIFYKTRLCAKFSIGNCSNGGSCNFAHGQEDLRDPPPNWEEYAPPNRKGAGGDQRPTRGLKICRKFFYEKECPYGEKCNFLHEYPYNTDMARSLPMDISATSIGTMQPVMEHRNDTGQTRLNKQLNAGSDALLVKTDPACLKTENCPNLEITGQCTFKENFPRAHEQPGSSKTNINAPTQVTEPKKFVNWKPPRKIAGIYGDWLDGHVLPDNN